MKANVFNFAVFVLFVYLLPCPILQWYHEFSNEVAVFFLIPVLFDFVFHLVIFFLNGRKVLDEIFFVVIVALFCCSS